MDKVVKILKGIVEQSQNGILKWVETGSTNTFELMLNNSISVTIASFYPERENEEVSFAFAIYNEFGNEIKRVYSHSHDEDIDKLLKVCYETAYNQIHKIEETYDQILDILEKNEDLPF